MAGTAETTILAAPTDVTQWLLIISFGILAGAIGQGARAVVGLKKAQDEAAQRNESYVYDASKFWISMCLGAIAGALAAITTVPSDMILSTNLVMGVVAAGYAGSDFIEGVLSRALPTAPPVPAPATTQDMAQG